MRKKRMEDNYNPEQLRIDNEIRKTKLMLEKGAVFSDVSDQDNLPPEVENEFLRNIEMFDQAFNSAKQISVYDFIGKPSYKKCNEIRDHKIGLELETLMQSLNDNGIALDTLCDVDERLLYTFITEELFFHEIDDMRVEGMVCHFIYEDFHPNHEYDIRNHATDFVRSFLDKDSDYFTTFMTKESENDISYKNIRGAFNSFTIREFEILYVTFNEQHANVNFKIDFTGIIESSHELLHFSGQGNMEMVYLYDFWCIHKVNFPGIN
jgi:hypothetical protein